MSDQQFKTDETVQMTESQLPPRVFGDRLSNHGNSLNFLRLVMASVVLLSHAAALGWFTTVGVLNNTSAAQVALYGFFAVSGYLITQSAMRTSAAGYLWRRVLRIFPGLIICLVITSAVFGVIAWFGESHVHCGFTCYLSAPDSPFLYVVKNALLANPFWTQHTIAGTPHAIIASWNVPIWTLFYEFLCYLIVLALGIIGLLKRRIWTLLITIGLWASVTVITLTPWLSAQFSVYSNAELESLMRFAEIFLTAAALYLYRDRLPDRGWLAIACAIIYVIGIVLPTGNRIPTYSFTPSDIFLPLLVYPVLWLGLHLPFRSIGVRNDYSYGIYIYGMPITQLLVLWNVEKFGLVPYVTCCFIATLPFAIGSWWLIEKRALSLKNRVGRRRTRGVVPSVR